jgi:hypothetical protein
MFLLAVDARDRRDASPAGCAASRAIPLAVLILSSLAAVPQQRLTSDQIIDRHVAQGALGAVVPVGHVRGLHGTVTLTGATVASALTGTFEFTSEAASSRLAVRFGTETYEGESWSSDGRRVEVAFAYPRTNTRSPLGIFLWTNTVVMSEGLLGGVLNARWPLLDIRGRQAHVSYDGLTTLRGRKLHRLRYRARQHQGPLEVLIFLDPATYRHVATAYSTSLTPGVTAAADEQSGRRGVDLRLEEWFSDPVRFGADALPQTWTLRYVRSGVTTSEWTYEFRIARLIQHAAGADRPAPAGATLRSSGGD